MDKDVNVLCPFTIRIDSREQQPYTFAQIISDAKTGHRPITVSTVRAALPVGDYDIEGMPGVVIERKSKMDLYASVAKRDNFVYRLERMSKYDYAAIVVESEFLDLLTNPPPFTDYRPVSLSRTIIAWRQRHRVDWWFLPTRDHAEVMTYRILDRYHADRQKREKNP